ncbi:hypothetical protein ACIBEA_40280 [Streptomyces sp. NPDC051555]|uniref:hypothetical protein n=1 Tax=Streptomyces sp. NPDC051555 TaxID=3365657 RepID=UPI0037A29B29
MTHSPDLDPKTTATEFAGALARLASTYPTDGEDTEPVTLLLDAARQQDGAPQPRRLHQLAVQMQPGQIRWLTQLVERELATTRNAHSDGNGHCGHCYGSGTVDPTGERTHLLGWFSGEEMIGDPSSSGWELGEAEDWHQAHETGTERIRLGGMQDSDPVLLEEQVAVALGPDTEIVQFRRITYAIEDVEIWWDRAEWEEAENGRATVDWKFPMFEIRTRPATPAPTLGAVASAPTPA